MNMEATLEYISVGCNRLTQALAWGVDGLAAFGAHHAVALYNPMDPARRGVRSTLQGHTARVNCVAFINRGHELEQKNVAIVSGSADKTVRIWKRHGDDKWICSAVLEGHTGSVITIGVIRARSIQGEKDLLATGSGDGTIKIWERVEIDNSKGMDLSSQPNSCLKGHDNWVRSLDFATFTKEDGATDESDTGHQTSKNTSHHHTLQDGDLLLASGSQDKYIRLWRISPVDKSEESQDDTVKAGSEGALTQDMLKSLEEMSKSGTQLSTKAHIIDVALDSAETKRFSVIFEALLLGHEDWVYTINWQPPMLLNGKYYQPMSLLSASTDKSMMIWKPDESTGVWINSTQVGEVGGNTIGFYGGLFGPDGRWILAYGYNGAFHIWKNEGNETTDRWVPQVSASGHYASVQDLTWDPTQSYLVTVSLDQTARLFSPWKHTEEVSGANVSTWHEIARPQIHGYDAQCIAFSDKWTFVSGSDEKVLRVFDAPQTFVRSLAHLTGNDAALAEVSSRPVGANLPALGLSNKAVFENDIASMVEAQESEDYLSDQAFVSTGATPTSLIETMTHPPFEEHLLQHTLWPEVEKLFGHGYELMCVDASHDGKWVASACKAHTPDQAGVRLFDAHSWKQTPAPLVSHTLTVTKVKFSHSDKYLLSISRDRLWSVYERVNVSNKAHARILWDCSWSHDDTLFATGSRDKTVKIWKTSIWTNMTTIKLPEAVTAVEFAPSMPGREETQKEHVLAVGLEDGRIFLFRCLAEKPEEWTLLREIAREFTHAGMVNGLAWRLAKDENGALSKLQLASCGVDHSVRLFNVTLQ
ncbi:Elongator subunit elp2 [Gamsiella multidivaricata]|nr:Elongator subunit elp2 [Gamsiella multidivaricata]